MISFFFFALGLVLGWLAHGSVVVQWIKRVLP